MSARQLLRSHRYGALSTLSKKLSGFPFGSITPYMVDHDGSLIILISALAEHTKNIESDPRVSLITHNQESPDIQMQGRVTLVGNAYKLTDHSAVRERYLRHFPKASELLTLDFSFYRIEAVAIRYIGGVGQVHWVKMGSYPAHQADNFARHEAELLHDINTRQQDTLQHLAQGKAVQAVSLDCDGMDLSCGEQFFRLNLTEAMIDPDRYRDLATLIFSD